MSRRRIEAQIDAPDTAPPSRIMSHPSLELRPVAQLKENPRNARVHSKKQVRQIAESIRRFGFTNPVLVDSHGTLLAGHARVAAAKLLGMEFVPCLRIDSMTEAEKRAYGIADNKLALNAGWDEEILAEELKALAALDLDFDIDITGFSIAEIDSLIEGLALEEPGSPEEDRLPTDCPARCRLGDVWMCGSKAMSAAQAPSAIRSSPWPPAR
jgi:ParB-like chromosome segregation protein Spo0J